MDSGGAGAPVRDRRGVTHRDHKRGLPPVRRDRNGEGCPGALRDRQTAIATSPTAPWPCRRTECLGKVHDDSLAKFAAARRPTTIAKFGSPSEFFPAHPWLRVEIRALVRFTEVQGFLCIDAADWLASRASRRPPMPLQRTAGPPSRFIAPACRRRAAFPDPQFWLPEIPVAWTSQWSAPFGNNGPRRQVGRSPRPLVPACR
jgi:hypothetical protein